jgi:L-rhamnose mutarotase
MERAAIHLRIREGMRDAYREEHEDVHDALERAYLHSDAGLERFSVFEKGGDVFVYVEAEDVASLRSVMETSRAQEEWDAVMEDILDETEGETWLDEVYRLV